MSENKMSVFSAFQANAMSYEDAQKKVKEESGSSVQYLKTNVDGKYILRILPLAPPMDSEGNFLPLDRKSYEYPSREMFIGIDTGKVDTKGKPKLANVKIINAKQVLKGIPSDLLDKYVELAISKYSDDEAVCKKIKSGTFEGGLKWSSYRNMYVLDAKDDKTRAMGPQLLSLSYSQYKELEEKKMDIWAKLNKKGQVPCPISSIANAFYVELNRKTENKKVSYSIVIDTLSGEDELDEKELTTLVDAQRLPEVLYKYTRRQLEATIIFLGQYDTKLGIDVMSSPEIKDCIDQISMALPADDNSHFDANAQGSNNAEQNGADAALTIDQLWDLWDRNDEEGFDDGSDEGQDLRDDIKDFIENNNLNIRVDRRKTNKDLLNEIEDVLGDNAPAPAPEPEQEPEPEPELEPATPAQEPEPEEQERSPRGRRNDDTNEPAARPSRRAARPERRR